MAFKNAQQSRVMLGKLNLSGYTRSISAPSTVDMLDVTTLADTAKTFIPGMNTSTFSVDLLLDTDTTSGGEWDVVTTWKGTPQVLSYFPSGLTAGSECLLVQANEGSMAPSASVGDAVGMSIATQTDGGTDAGVSLLPITTFSGTGNSYTAVDNGALTSNGGVAHLHVTGYTSGSQVIKVQHSTDDNTYADLVTFTTLAGTTSERVVVAAGATVNRYLRVNISAGGSVATTFQVSFARR